MRRLLDRLRGRVLLWLGTDESINRVIVVERAHREAAVTQLGVLADQNAKMAAALHQIVAQLNRNSLMLQRWAVQSETLRYIEEQHARKEAILAGGKANGHSDLILPPGVR